MHAHDQLKPILAWAFDDAVAARPVNNAKARLLLLDTIGCLLAGLEAAPVRALAALHSGTSPGPIRLPGCAPVSVEAATEIGGTAIVWDEACEGLARAHGRPGIAVIAAALPLALARDQSLAELLSAVVAGYEIGGRMGAWLRIRPGMHVDAGWPALGAAAGVARLLGLDAARALNAIEIAACQVPFGLYAPVKAGANGRNTYIAHAALLGGLAARSAAAGADAPTDGLAEYARIALGLDATNVDLVPAGLPLILEGYLKPYPSVRHAHYGTAAALALRPRIADRLEAITTIELACYAEAITYASNPAPATPLAAQFSLSFGVAAALRFGALTPEVYRPERFHDPMLRRLESRVHVVCDAERTARGVRGATLTVRTATVEHVAAVDHVRGDPSDPMSAEECCAKFATYAEPRVSAATAQSFAHALLTAPAATKMRDLWQDLGDPNAA